MLAEGGAAGHVVDHARDARSAGEVLQLARRSGVPLADAVAGRARAIALDHVGDACAVEVMIYDRDGDLVGRAPGW